MKKITFILLLSMVTIFTAEAHKNRGAYVTISIQNFYDELSPYGDWIYTPDYGYAWRPYFDYPEAFRPYSSNGHWVNTEYGWTWVSGYSWGWATFHYGRWAFDDYMGWMWIPGTEWAPAWVTWGSYDNCWGWAPLGPSIYVSYNSGWSAPVAWWTFVPRNRFCYTNWNTYIYNRPVRVTNITNITNVYVTNNNYNSNNSWYYGPRVNDVERYSGSRVRRYAIEESSRPDNTGIRNNRLDVYRPTVENRRENNRPAEYRNIEQARTNRRIEQTNARTNDPGNNRTRGIKTEARTITQIPTARNENVNRETRNETRTTTQVPASRSENVNREAKTETRTTTQPSVENRKAAPAPQRNTVATEPKRQEKNSARVETPRTRQGNAVEAPTQRVNRSAASQNAGRQSTTANPSREQRNVNATPTSKPERAATQKEVKKAESRNSGENKTRNSSANPTRK